jgi:hypothetical protein
VRANGKNVEELHSKMSTIGTGRRRLAVRTSTEAKYAPLPLAGTGKMTGPGSPMPPIQGTARKTAMARKVLDRRASLTQSQKTAKKTAKPMKTATKLTKAPPAKTVKRVATPDKKLVTTQKKPGVPEKKPVPADKKLARGEKPAVPGAKKGVAAVKTSAAPGAAKVVGPKVKKPRAKKAPPRMRVRWCVYDGMMKPVAMFDYNKRKEAEASLAQYLQKKPTYFLQPVKEPMPPEPEVPEAN